MLHLTQHNTTHVPRQELFTSSSFMLLIACCTLCCRMCIYLIFFLLHCTYHQPACITSKHLNSSNFCFLYVRFTLDNKSLSSEYAKNKNRFDWFCNFYRRQFSVNEKFFLYDDHCIYIDLNQSLYPFLANNKKKLLSMNLVFIFIDIWFFFSKGFGLWLSFLRLS